MEARGIGLGSLKSFCAANPTYLMLDFTGLSLYEHCGMKYHLIRNEKLQEAKSISALFGSELMHPVLSAWYLGGCKAPPNDLTWDNLWNSFVYKLSPTELANAGFSYTKDHFIKACTQYIETYGDDLEKYRVVSSEEIYWAVLPNTHIIWVSKPDLVLERLLDRKLVSSDFKSSVWDIHQALNPFDRQFLGQAHNTGADFMMKLHILLPRSKPKTGEAKIIIKRTIEPVDPDLMAEWIREAQFMGEEIQRSYDTGVWPKRSPRACTEFRRVCEFRNDVCPMGLSKGDIIEGMEKTNPMEYLGL